MKSSYDIAVIGAGPAGMAAATTAAEYGLNVLLVDEQTSPGGQIYRGIENPLLEDREVLGQDYYAGQSLARSLRDSQVEYLSGATVWSISKEREIGLVIDGKSHLITAQEIIIATGAIERPFPVAGWTLPGVMTAGAAQILLKTSAAVTQDAVFVGSGPLLYLIVSQYLQAGVRVRALLDTTPRRNYRDAAPLIANAFKGMGYLRKGARMLHKIRQSGTTRTTGVEALRLQGNSHVEQIEYLKDDVWRAIDTHQVFLHQGVIPNTNLSMATGCQHIWDEQQLCWRPEIDQWGGTSLTGVSIAGDGAGIAGAVAAALHGEITALQAVCALGGISSGERSDKAAPLQSRLSRERGFRPFLETLYRPAQGFRTPTDDNVVICRCEEVTAGQIRDALKLGCTGPNQLKAFTRCGMGPCQGRMCGTTVCELIAKEHSVPVAEVGHYRVRTPVKPITLGQLATME